MTVGPKATSSTAVKNGSIIEIFAIPGVLATALLLVVVASWLIGKVDTSFGGWTHRPDAIYGFAATCTMASLWLILNAIFSYLNIGQKKKIEIIIGFYTPNTIADYFNEFWLGRDGFGLAVKNYRNAKAPARENYGRDLETRLRSLFADDFGLRVYLIPVILLVVAGGIALFMGFAGGVGLALDTLTHPHASPVEPLGISMDVVSVAAIFGAYTWVASDVIVRNHLWTLHPSDLAWYALRFVVAIPLGEAIAVTVDKGTGGVLPVGAGAFLAFVANLFSLDAITAALGTAASRFGLATMNNPNECNDLIVKLAGVDDSKARALYVEGVSTITQMTTVDPIRTSIRSGLPFEFILNLIDASLLWQFAGQSLEALRILGMRGASDVIALRQSWRAADEQYACRAKLKQADEAVILAQQALTALQNATPKDTGAIFEAEQAASAAVSLRLLILADFLNLESSSPPKDRTAMIQALTIKLADGGPGLTEVGFDTIAARLEDNSYAVFIKTLLES